MRQLVRTYEITGAHEITITDLDFTASDIRLIINESLASSATTSAQLKASVLVSSIQKGNVVSVVNGVITLANTTANLTVGDDLTIEIDTDVIGDLSDIIDAINGDTIDGIINSYMNDYAEELETIIGFEEESSDE